MAYSPPAANNIDFVFAESPYTPPAANNIDFVFGEGDVGDSSSVGGDSDVGWEHTINGVSGSSISSLFLGAVDMGSVSKINTVGE